MSKIKSYSLEKTNLGTLSAKIGKISELNIDYSLAKRLRRVLKFLKIHIEK